MDELIAQATSLWVWIEAHPVLAVLFLIGAVFNTMPRPHPDDPKLSFTARIFWTFIDRLCFLSAIAIPGKLKWFLTPSPVPPGLAPSPGQAPPAAPREGDLP